MQQIDSKVSLNVHRAGNLQNPQGLMILLHGLGADGTDLLALKDGWADLLPDMVFSAPDAPFPCDSTPYGRQWFSFFVKDNYKALKAEITLASEILDHFINAELKKFDLNEAKLTLLGFSQGAMMALHTGLRRKKPLRALMAFSGALLFLPEQEKVAMPYPKIFLAHGLSDVIVPPVQTKHTKDMLEALHIKAEAVLIPHLAHSIDPDCARDFIRRHVSSFPRKLS